MTTLPTVGILHPGSMGAAIAGCAAAHASSVLWCPTGRSPASVSRAQEFGLVAVDSMRELLDRSDIVISLCPPAAAEELASEVARVGFSGVYVEANAISPERTHRIAAMINLTGSVVDGGVVGNPPVGGMTPMLYLSGPPSLTAKVEGLFSGTDVHTKAVGEAVGQASALKLSFAAFQKVSRVLVALSYGLAREHGVDQELRDISAWLAGSFLAQPEYTAQAAARAWRWGPEMNEIGDALEQAGLPPEILRGAAAALARWDGVKDDSSLTWGAALDRLARP